MPAAPLTEGGDTTIPASSAADILTVPDPTTVPVETAPVAPVATVPVATAPPATNPADDSTQRKPASSPPAEQGAASDASGAGGDGSSNGKNGSDGGPGKGDGGTNDGGNGGGDGDGVKTVDLAVLADKEVPSNKTTREVLPPIAKVGYKLALWVFGLICTTTVLIFVVAFGFTTQAQPPGPLNDFDAASIERYQRAVDLYKQIGDLPLQRARELFQLLVITAFLPSFTAILGYIFGTRGGGNATTGTSGTSER